MPVPVDDSIHEDPILDDLLLAIFGGASLRSPVRVPVRVPVPVGVPVYGH